MPVIQPYEFPRYFELELIKFPISAAMFSMIFHRLMCHVETFLLLHSGYSFITRVSISAYLPFWHRMICYFVDFRQLQVPNVQAKYYKMYIYAYAYRKLVDRPRYVYMRYIYCRRCTYNVHIHVLVLYKYAGMDEWMDGRIALIVFRGQTVVLALRPCSAIA